MTLKLLLALLLVLGPIVSHGQQKESMPKTEANAQNLVVAAN